MNLLRIEITMCFAEFEFKKNYKQLYHLSLNKLFFHIEYFRCTWMLVNIREVLIEF